MYGKDTLNGLSLRLLVSNSLCSMLEAKAFCGSPPPAELVVSVTEEKIPSTLKMSVTGDITILRFCLLNTPKEHQP